MQKQRVCLTLLAAAVVINLFCQEAPAQTTKATTKAEAIAAAKNKNANRTYRSTPTGTGALTPEMIEQCIRLNIAVDSSYAAIGKTKEKFDALNKELTDLGERLKAAKDKVYSGGAAARKDYDSKVLYYNSRLPELDTQLKE